MSESAAVPRSAWRQSAQAVGHRLVHKLLPLSLRLQRRMARSGYARLLAAYRLHYLQQRLRFPVGVPYRLLGIEAVAPGVNAYRLQSPAGVRHHAGQTVLLEWHNEAREVEDFLRARGWEARTPVRALSAGSSYSPGRWHQLELGQALRTLIDVRDAASDRSQSPVPAPLALSTLPRLHGRSYSITGIEHTPQGEVIEILVTLVEDLKTGASRPGRCSGYLSRLMPDDVVRGWPLDFPMTLGPDPRANVPLLMVSTGIAAAGPLFEYESLRSRRPLWLVLGLRVAEADQAYQQRLLDFAQRHPGSRIDVALSRDDAPALLAGPSNVHWHGRCYVQDVLRAQGRRWADLVAGGGDTIVVGHTGMGSAVQEVLRQQMCAHGLAPDAQGAAHLQRKLEDALRLQYSLSGR